MALEIGERRKYVRMLARRVEEENEAFETLSEQFRH